MAVALITEPSGARLPTGNTTVLVRPRARARSGSMITSSGGTPSAAQAAWAAARRGLSCQASSTSPRVRPLTVRAPVCSRPARRRCSITSGTPPAANTWMVGWPIGPLGSASTSRGVLRLTRAQSWTVGIGRPAACATAGRCSSRLVEPPNAAYTTMALCSACSVSRSPVRSPASASATSASAERRAMSSHTGSPEGARAACGRDRPSPSATTWAVAAVPRNWQPPPGLPHARQPMVWACSRLIRPCAKRAPMVCTRPVSSESGAGRVTPPGTMMPGSVRRPATASSMAGSPLSQVATPSTPLRVGSERARRRITRAASLRYGRLSNMPGVP